MSEDDDNVAGSFAGAVVGDGVFGDDVIAEIVAALPADRPRHRRFIIAIGGPPASGKTTLAAQLQSRVAPTAAVLGMDAFHYDNAILKSRGHLDRKGAPHTFDVAAYRNSLQRLRDQPGEVISIPVFDRELELSRNCAAIVSDEHSIVITEGNYLLLTNDPWADLHELFDLTIFCKPSRESIEARLIERWLGHGYSLTDAQAKTHQNDLPNADLVLATSADADLVIA